MVTVTTCLLHKTALSIYRTHGLFHQRVQHIASFGLYLLHVDIIIYSTTQNILMTKSLLHPQYMIGPLVTTLSSLYHLHHVN